MNPCSYSILIEEVVRILLRLTSLILAFLLLACTITAMSAAMYEPSVLPPAEESATADEKVLSTQPATEIVPTESKLIKVIEHGKETEGYTPRLNAPNADNLYYYSSDNIFYASDYGMPNCTCYAWGRAYEITGEIPELSPYDACTWYDYNAENEIYDYGEIPEEGAIACFSYANGGSGHVAVVEEVNEDSVLLSNSAYNGTEFYMDTVPVDNPSQGHDGWIFQGYIYVNE